MKLMQAVNYVRPNNIRLFTSRQRQFRQSRTQIAARKSKDQ